jgi:hypothetical protein
MKPRMNTTRRDRNRASAPADSTQRPQSRFPFAFLCENLRALCVKKSSHDAPRSKHGATNGQGWGKNAGFSPLQC